MSTRIRRAEPGDVGAITAMIHELAAFEHAADQCTVTETQIHTALFNDPAVANAHVAEVGADIAAMAVWFLNFSTWEGAPGIHLEDLYVRPTFRRRGLARALLSTLAGHCISHGYPRLSWAVLNWNTDAITLYDAVGAQPQREWTSYRLSGPGLAGLAGSD